MLSSEEDDESGTLALLEEDNNLFADDDDDDDEEEEDAEADVTRDPPTGCVRLRPSTYHGLPSTVFFEYPVELRVKRNDLSTIEPLHDRKLLFKSYWKRICVNNAFKRAGYELTDKSSKWTALWSKHQNAKAMAQLNCLQKVNHFQASWCVGRKDRLLRTLNAMKRIHSEEFNFHPEGFVLPAERLSFLRQVNSDVAHAKSRMESGGKKRNLEMSSIWICKPVAASCGKGIRVLTASQALKLPKNKKALLQRYLHNPYLIDGKKFDLRIYVVITGVDPLRVYVHNEGLTRISTETYSLKDTGNRFVHLTNYSINKKSDKFVAASIKEGDTETEGYKWSLRAFKNWLSEREGADKTRICFERIHDLVLKTMIAAESELTPKLHSEANFRTNCFELFGCDVILDKHLNPHLLEVNVSPSLMGSSPLDRKIKGTMLSDLFHLVGFHVNDQEVLKRFNDSDDSPFAFHNISKLMTGQDSWRRSPTLENIDLRSLGSTPNSSWYSLLMIDDEFSRVESTQFTLLHPTVDKAEHYLSLYRIQRFSDHLLAKWVVGGRLRGSAGLFVPLDLLPAAIRGERQIGKKHNVKKLGVCGHTKILPSSSTESEQSTVMFPSETHYTKSTSSSACSSTTSSKNVLSSMLELKEDFVLVSAACKRIPTSNSFEDLKLDPSSVLAKGRFTGRPKSSSGSRSTCTNEHNASSFNTISGISGVALKPTVQLYADRTDDTSAVLNNARPKSAGSSTSRLQVRPNSSSFVEHIRSLKSYNESEVNSVLSLLSHMEKLGNK